MICWLFTGKLGAPGNLLVSDVYAEHCKLSWTPPTDDGGSEITGKHHSTLFDINHKIINHKMREFYCASDLHREGALRNDGRCVRPSVCRVPRPNSGMERPIGSPKSAGRKPITRVTSEPI